MPPSRSRLWNRFRHHGQAVRQAFSTLLDPMRGRRRGAPAIFTGRAMGTYYRITLARPPTEAGPEYMHALAWKELEWVEGLMSAYRPESEVCRFNAADTTEWFPVSPDTAGCVALALEVGRLSGGLYDITAGPLENVWGFGPTGEVAGIPDEAQIAEARDRIGLAQIVVRLEPPGLRKANPCLTIDLASIAKGLGVDLASQALERSGVRDHCVEVGGEVRTAGRNPLGLQWQIAIDSPVEERQAAHCTVPLRNLAMATSGDYRIYHQSNGGRYAHILDPRTGRPVTHSLASVTVVDPACARADAWATALFVAGPEDGYRLAVKENLPALLITRTPSGFAETRTPQFPS